jgi:hypothetical protein
VSGNHSIIESDAEGSCIKSLKEDLFTSGGVFTAPNQLRVPVSKEGTHWFFCGVPGHCESGMNGTLIVKSSEKFYVLVAFGVVNGSVVIIMAVYIFIERRMYKNQIIPESSINNKVYNHGKDDNILQDCIIQILNQNKNNQIPNSGSQIQNNQTIPAASTSNN